MTEYWEFKLGYIFYFSLLPNVLWHVDPLLENDAKEVAIQQPLLSNGFTNKHVFTALITQQ
jgi:hypothetical protein